MSQEQFGAFVELDQHKLTRDQLVLLGMKTAMDMWVEELRSHAVTTEVPVAKQVLNDVANRMATHRDELAVVLTRSAVASGSGVLNTIKGGKAN